MAHGHHLHSFSCNENKVFCSWLPVCVLSRTAIWLQVGLDSKAVGEAWQAINKKHNSLPVAIFTSDASKWAVNA